MVLSTIARKLIAVVYGAVSGRSAFGKRPAASCRLILPTTDRGRQVSSTPQRCALSTIGRWSSPDGVFFNHRVGVDDEVFKLKAVWVFAVNIGKRIRQKRLAALTTKL